MCVFVQESIKEPSKKHKPEENGEEVLDEEELVDEEQFDEEEDLVDGEGDELCEEEGKSCLFLRNLRHCQIKHNANYSW